MEVKMTDAAIFTNKMKKNAYTNPDLACNSLTNVYVIH